MSDNKLSVLPHVLTEYKPDYDPISTPKSKVRSVHKCEADASHERSHDHGNPHKKQDCGHHRESRSNTSMSATSGKKSGGSKKLRKSDGQRYEELSSKWDQARQEVRQEDHETLREKIVLQQELIRKQDEYAKNKRAQEAEAEAQKREAEKARKSAKEAELNQICRQSLEEDKKNAKEEKKAKLRLKKSENVSPSPTKSPTTPTTAGSRRSNPFKMTLPAMSATPDILDSDDECEQEKTQVIPQDAPWHEQQLYKLYGKKADYFLHPKIETKKQVKKTNPKLRRQGGRAGAEVLWQTLRHDSNVRLLKEDASIPSELKDAYGSFARQSLKKSTSPVRRMYCVVDDLPEMPRLIDNRKLQRVRKMHHKSDLMYRASVSNQDRTEVLKFNNPLPEFHMGTESIDQYLPSWQDDQSVSTQLEYVKWLNGRTARENTIQEEGDDYDSDGALPQKPAQVMRSLDDDLIYILARRKQFKPKQKYVFLSEKDTTVKGEFSEKYKDEREYKDIPRPYKGVDLPKSYSALGGMLSASPDIKTSDSALRYSAPLPTRATLLKNYTSGWEPLSMHALVEYKRQVGTVGEGDFNLGRTKMWSSSIPVV